MKTILTFEQNYNNKAASLRKIKKGLISLILDNKLKVRNNYTTSHKGFNRRKISEKCKYF